MSFRQPKITPATLKSCWNKVRYPDEFVARAVGQEIQLKREVKLYIYPCNECRGFHLTRKTQSERTRWASVDYDHSTDETYHRRFWKKKTT